MRRQGSSESIGVLGKMDSSRKRGSPNKRWTDSIKAAIGMSLNRAAEDGTLWPALIHRVARSRSRLKGMGMQEEAGPHNLL